MLWWNYCGLPKNPQPTASGLRQRWRGGVRHGTEGVGVEAQTVHLPRGQKANEQYALVGLTYQVSPPDIRPRNRPHHLRVVHATTSRLVVV